MPRLLLALCSIKGKNNDNNKNHPTDEMRLTGSLHISKLARKSRAKECASELVPGMECIESGTIFCDKNNKSASLHDVARQQVSAEIHSP
jgi:hypothetical protein